MKIQTMSLNQNDRRALQRWINRSEERFATTTDYYLNYGRGGVIEVTPGDEEANPHAIARTAMVAIGRTFNYEVQS